MNNKENERRITGAQKKYSEFMEMLRTGQNDEGKRISSASTCRIMEHLDELDQYRLPSPVVYGRSLPDRDNVFEETKTEPDAKPNVNCQTTHQGQKSHSGHKDPIALTAEIHQLSVMGKNPGRKHGSSRNRWRIIER